MSTIGSSVILVAEPSDRWAASLADLLTSAGLDVEGPMGPGDLPGEPLAARAAIDFVVVDVDAKRRALTALDTALPPQAPIITCCHAASATELARGLSRPERLVGFGLLPPWEERTAVECTRTMATTDEAAAAAAALWAEAGLMAEWVGDGAGLVVARTVACLANEASFAVMERAAGPEDIDRAMELGTRYPRGPLEWATLIGLDHVVAILDGLAREHGDDRYRTAPLLRRMAAAARSR